jgi:hypothetical protein
VLDSQVLLRIVGMERVVLESGFCVEGCSRRMTQIQMVEWSYVVLVLIDGVRLYDSNNDKATEDDPGLVKFRFWRCDQKHYRESPTVILDK